MYRRCSRSERRIRSLLGAEDTPRAPESDQAAAAGARLMHEREKKVRGRNRTPFAVVGGAIGRWR